MERLRRAFEARPRLVLGILLAFAIEIVPSVAPLTHHHAGGDRSHVHAVPLVGSARPVAWRPSTDDGRQGRLERASAGRHPHFTHAVVGGVPPLPESGSPLLLVGNAPRSTALHVARSVDDPGRARSPPLAA